MNENCSISFKETPRGETAGKPPWPYLLKFRGDRRAKPAAGGYTGRMATYLGEMYPVPKFLGTWALIYLGFTAILARIHGVHAHFFSWNAASGIASLFAFGLILRLMDELKDRDIDQELFSHRPLPSGRVSETDIKISLAAAMAMFMFVNAFMGRALPIALFLLGYSLLMFRFFFMPDILRRYLLLTLATHNPVVALTLLYVVAVFAQGNGLSLAQIHWPQTLLLIAMFWAMLFAWEVARKIRSREEENAYVSYSRILGRPGSVLLAGGAQTISFVIGIYFYSTLALSLVFLTVLTIGYVRTAWAHLRFLAAPGPVTSKLRPYAEHYILITALAGLLDYLAQWREAII